MVEYRGESGTIPAYLARPTDGGPRPGVLVIHELFGLVDHTKDVASRIAREGYVALAPNLFASRDLAAVLTPDAVQKAMQFMFRLPRRDPVLVEEELAKLPADERAIVAPTVRQLIGGLPKDRLTRDLVAAVAYLRGQRFVVPDRIGSVGFCFGGGMSARVACEGGIRACVIFYGENPTPIDRVRDRRGRPRPLRRGRRQDQRAPRRARAGDGPVQERLRDADLSGRGARVLQRHAGDDLPGGRGEGRLGARRTVLPTDARRVSHGRYDGCSAFRRSSFCRHTAI